MSPKPSGAELPKLLHWSRTGVVEGSWGPYESFESLVFAQAQQTELQKLALGFLGCQDFCARAKLPWRRGTFIFGPPGCGKSAASRAIALLLGWTHLTIPAHEILDANMMTRALIGAKDCINGAGGGGTGVVVLDNLDQMFQRVEPDIFVDIFDHVSERMDGIFWVATTRKPEDVPKNSLLRPGRFEESVRMATPTAEVKKRYYETHIEPFMAMALGGAPDAAADSVPGMNAVKMEHIDLLEQNDQLTYAHLQEMRLLIAKVLMDGNVDRLASDFQTFCQEQLISGDRWGGPTVAATALAERVRHLDPRLLLSSLDVVDAFRRVVETTVSNASDALLAAKTESTT